MKIFILDLENFDKNILLEFEKNCPTAATKRNELKKLQHLAGRFLLDYVAKNSYNLSDTSITYDGEKPIFKNSDLHFSISHCKNLVVVGFSEHNIGIDVEYNKKERDFVAIIERFDKTLAKRTKPLSKEEQQKIFYEFWTKYEAEIKLGKTPLHAYTTTIKNDFTLSAVSEQNFDCKNILTFLDS